jgi:hypothetical protein
MLPVIFAGPVRGERLLLGIDLPVNLAVAFGQERAARRDSRPTRGPADAFRQWPPG